jgi:phosphatidylserine/phosphatidylglycerophosphate/cardiolipin synthase-like enzyme
MRRAGAVLMYCGLILACGVLQRSCTGGGSMRAVHAESTKPIPTQAPAPVQAVVVHYSPAENLEPIDVELLDQAKTTLDISTFAMDDKPIAEELVKLAGRGVSVRIYRDRTQYSGEVARGKKGGVDLSQLFAGQPNIHLRVKGSVALAHLKAFVVDGKLLREGSANWSVQGEKVQDNSLLVVRDPAAVARFETNFEAIWARPGNQVIYP